MPFGDLVTPRVFRDQTPHAFTIVDFFRTVSRALLAVGFKPLPSWGFMFQDVPLESIDLSMSYAQAATADDTSAQYRHPALFFDFPDDVPTFVDPAGVTRKLTIEIRHYFVAGPTDSTVSQGNMALRLIVDIRTRRIDLDPAISWYAAVAGNTLFDCTRKARGIGISQHNFGSVYAAAYGLPGGTFPNGKGSMARSSYWQISQNDLLAGSTAGGGFSLAGRVNRFAMSHIFVALSPAGFVFQIGRGTRKNDAGDVFNVGIAFSGRRVPGRGVAPAADLDLAASCPFIYHVFDTDQTDADGEFCDTVANGNRLNGILYGAKFSPTDSSPVVASGPVRCRTYALDNLDLMSRPVRDRMAVLASPRTVGEQVRHILSPMVFEAYETVATPVQYLAPIVPSYSTTVTLARWRDVFFTDRFVISDPAAPYGFFTDPTSGKEFYMFQMHANGTMLGMDVSGYAPVSYVAPVHPLLDTTDLVTTSGALVSAGPVSVTETGKSGSWTYAGNGEMQHTYTTGEVANATVWTFNVNADPLDRFYVLEFEYRQRGTNVGDGPLLIELNTQRQQYFNNPLLAQCRDTPGGIYRECFGDLLGCAGTYPTDPNYEYRVCRVYLRRTVGVTKNIEFHFTPDYYGYPGGDGSKTILIRNVKLRRYQFNY